MEVLCGKRHISIAEAVTCAEQSLGTYHKPSEPYRGRTSLNDDVVVGFQAGPKRRFRLDLDKNWRQKINSVKAQFPN